MSERKLVAIAALLGVFVFAGASLFQSAQAQSKGKPAQPTAEENRAELEKKYVETEKLVAVGSTDKRPGIKAWAEIQGAAEDLTWPAKYYLPWPAGESRKVYQSWNGNKIGPPQATHMQPQNYYAWDFNIVRGQYICAARDGTVTQAWDQEPAGKENDNCLKIKHVDGEESVYAHIGSNTSLVKIGDKVLAGQKICQGSNESQHLHFVIWKGMIDYPCRFIDYAATNGVPQYGASPVSGNKGTPQEVIDQIKADYAKGEAAFAAAKFDEALRCFRAATAREVLIDEYEKSLARIDECKAEIDKEITAGIEEARKGDFAGADKRFKALKKKFGDKEAQDRIEAALNELKADPKFKEWVAQQMAQRQMIEAKAAEDKEDWDKALKIYREILKAYKKDTQEYKDVKKKIQEIEIKKGLGDG
jgi:murein DD-endopeptidase MepM/ murein hydrolase activator NlpD